jgi:predicted metal-dependent HD superfamily phosphohydrolase
VYRRGVLACRHQPLVLPPSLAGELAAAYGEPHRAYHDATHIAEVLGWFDTVADDVGWQQPAEVYVAIAFHDAIYVPGAKDNEARSAAWARRSGLPVDLDRVGELILLTATHGKNAAVDDRDAALFLDCDMAILGAPADAFVRYDEAIRAEYASIPADHYRAGRRAFLAGLLARDRIYLSDYFHARLDAAARTNLTAALQR